MITGGNKDTKGKISGVNSNVVTRGKLEGFIKSFADKGLVLFLLVSGNKWK